MLKDSLIGPIVDTAKKNGIRPAALLALIEVETSGAPFEQDNRTPRFLFERHVMYRELKKKAPAKLALAVARGMAIPKWSKNTQYKDQGTSAKRLEVIAKAIEIDEECAKRSASWGLGQTMGFLAEEHGHPNAIEMIARMTDGGVPAQLAEMIRELKNKKIVQALNEGRYAAVALRYNGSGYAQNHYDTKLADADKRWTRRLATMKVDVQPTSPSTPARPTPPEQNLTETQIRQIQEWLLARGYTELGTADGEWGSRTTGAIAAFQAHEGLKVTGHYDDATAHALATAQARPVSETRADATVKDLREAGSRTVQTADKISLWGQIKMWLGLAGVGAAGAEQGGLLGQVQDGVDKVNQVKTVGQSVHELVQPVLGDPKMFVIFLILAAFGAAFAYWAYKVQKLRVEDHNTGAHAGPAGEGA